MTSRYCIRLRGRTTHPWLWRSSQTPVGIPGRGKRGGIRIIYYAKMKQDKIWLLTLYPKNVAENIPSHVLRQIKKEIDDEKDKSS